MYPVKGLTATATGFGKALLLIVHSGGAPLLVAYICTLPTFVEVLPTGTYMWSPGAVTENVG